MSLLRLSSSRGFSSSAKAAMAAMATMATMAAKMKGQVKWFNESRRFGFIIPEDGSQDVFFHVRAIQNKGVKKLAEGQMVEFEIDQGKMGRIAINVIAK